MLAWAAHLWPVGGSKHITSLERVWRIRDTVGHMTVLHVILCSVERGKAVFVKAFNTRHCWSYRNTDRGNSVILIKHTLNIIHFTFYKNQTSKLRQPTTFVKVHLTLNLTFHFQCDERTRSNINLFSLFLTNLSRLADRTFLLGFTLLLNLDSNLNFVAC